MSFFNIELPQYQKAKQKIHNEFDAIYNSIEADRKFAEDDIKMRIASIQAGKKGAIQKGDLALRKGSLDLSKGQLALKRKGLFLDNLTANRNIALDKENMSYDKKQNLIAQMIGVANLGTSTYFGYKQRMSDINQANRLLDLIRKQRR